MLNVFVDSGFIVAIESKDNYSRQAKEVFNYLDEKRIGLERFIISDYILIESFQLIQQRAGFQKALNAYHKYNSNCIICSTDKRIIESAIRTKLSSFINHRTQQPPIGLVDAISLVFMERYHTPWILSFDDGFDRIPLVKRISQRNGVDGLIL